MNRNISPKRTALTSMRTKSVCEIKTKSSSPLKRINTPTRKNVNK